MKFIKLSSLAVIILVVVACGFKRSPQPAPVKSNGMFEPVAVIELFTSQGCSSCPPADALLAQTITNAKATGKNIFALSFHVDYWNRLGWADPFSNAAYSARQKNYVTRFGLDGAYTPQMIVNGTEQFVGSDKDLLTQSLTKALNTKTAIQFKQLTATFAEGKPVKVNYAVEGDIAATTINFALVSLSETTVVKRGENGGRTLTNENIVRQLVSKITTTSGEIEFTSAAVAAKNNTAVIAFVQNEKSGQIIGAAMATMH
jgi:hypothetical protein